MIFVTVGSQKFQFDRLLKGIDDLLICGAIQDEVFAQTGASGYVPVHYESKAFLDRTEYQAKMKQCEFVITHGGTGAIVGALKENKKVIAVPRLKKYGEHVDNHQLQIIEQFVNCNYISSCTELDELEQVIHDVRKCTFSKFHSNTQEYITNIEKYIEGESV